MNCRTCEYPLWNLKARTCPECNTPFAPSQFNFRPNTVAFCCPGCNRAYYGTGAGGHLEPRAFTCVECGAPVHEDEMVLRPTSGVHEDATKYRPVPWLDPAIRSTFSRLARTTVWALFLPGQLGRRLPTPDRPWAALGFAALGVLLMLVPSILIMVLLGLLLPGGGLAGGGLIAVSMVIFGGVVWGLAALVPWAATAHITLWMTGEKRAGFGRTLSCMAYGIPACLPMAVPLVGLYLTPLGIVYWTVLAAATLRAGQRVSWLRAFVAAAALPVLAALGIGALIAFVVVPSYRNAMATVTAMQAAINPSQQAQALSAAVLAHSAANAGAGPQHMSELLIARTISAKDLMGGVVYRQDERAKIAGVHLMLVETPSPTTIATVRAGVAANRPTGPVIAHRFGDVVFTYHGIDLTAPPDTGLWILVVTPETSAFPFPPAPTGGATPGSTAPARPALAVANADGTTVEIADADFGAALDAQNALRRSHGLAGLPDPRKMVANAYVTPADAPAAPTPP